MFKAAIKFRDYEFWLKLLPKKKHGGINLQKFSLVSAADQDDTCGSFYSGIATGMIRVVAPNFQNVVGGIGCRLDA